MIPISSVEASRQLIERLRRAMDDHDLDGIVDCFAAEYRNEMPAHPSRGFVGREQVRQNWEVILRSVPDLHAELLRVAYDGDTVWSEWKHSGTRADGSPHAMAGVIIFGVSSGVFSWARFYLEPVTDAGGRVSDAVREQVVRPAPIGSRP